MMLYFAPTKNLANVGLQFIGLNPKPHIPAYNFIYKSRDSCYHRLASRPLWRLYCSLPDEGFHKPLCVLYRVGTGCSYPHAAQSTARLPLTARGLGPVRIERA